MTNENVSFLYDAVPVLRQVYSILKDPKTGVDYLFNRTTCTKAKMVKPHAVITIRGLPKGNPCNEKFIRKDTLMYLITHGRHPMQDAKNIRWARMSTVHKMFTEKTPYKKTNADRLGELKLEVGTHDQQIKNLQQEVRELKKALQEMQTKGW